MPAFLLPLLIKNWKIVAGALAVLAVLAWYGIQQHKAFNRGAEAERAKIEDANNAADKRADEGEKTVEACFAAGGNWDRARGVCERAGSGK